MPSQFLDENAYHMLSQRVESGDDMSELDASEKSALISYLGACHVKGRFIHPGELLMSGSELTSPEDTLYLNSALWKLGYNPTIPI